MTAAFTPKVVLESHGRGEAGKSYGFSGFVRSIEVTELDAVRPALDEIESASTEGLHAAGFISYEAAPAFDDSMVVQPLGDGPPLVWFGLFRERRLIEPDVGNGGPGGETWEPSITRDAFNASLGRIREYIQAGDTYQVNFTHRLRAEVGDPGAIYRRLAGAQRADFCAYIDTGRFKIVSASPELFFQIRDGRIVTRPMKGTRPRGPSAQEDNQMAADLARSDKDRAENLMIVDLLRNDLGRVCEAGTIEVGDLWAVERYETVLQMTSRVEGKLRTGVGVSEVVSALFPCGSVTGAPKVRTMEIIRELECSPRGIYTGALGYVSPGGESTFSVGIRTVCVDSASGIAEYGVGGGITYDSSPAREYAECVTKSKVLSTHRPNFGLFETVRFDPGAGVFLLDLHINRMARSADYFGFPFDPERFTDLLSRETEHSPETLRLRVVLARDGQMICERQEVPSSGPRTAVVSELPIDSRDPFLYHKTTHRVVYESQFARYRNVADTVILVNERGELTECLTANVVLKFGERYLTPPVSCGLLAGTFREDLVTRGEIEEEILTPKDVGRADAVMMINSIREKVLLGMVSPSPSQEKEKDLTEAHI